MSVLGIDPSLTGTGLATIEDGEPPALELIRTTGKATDTDLMKLLRMRRIADEVLDRLTLHNPDLVIIEGLSYASHGGATRDLAGLWWLIVSAIDQARRPLAICPPSTLKKWATGKGNASKSQVAMSMSRLWPTLWPDEDWPDDNRIDALALATIAAQHTGYDMPTRAHHQTARTAIKWPA